MRLLASKIKPYLSYPIALDFKAFAYAGADNEWYICSTWFPARAAMEAPSASLQVDFSLLKETISGLSNHFL